MRLAYILLQVSLVQYNREPFLEFSFRRHNCLSLLLEDINDTQFMNGVSNLGRALEKVMKFAFTQPRVSQFSRVISHKKL